MSVTTHPVDDPIVHAASGPLHDAMPVEQQPAWIALKQAATELQTLQTQDG